MLADLFDCRRGTEVLSIDPGNLDIQVFVSEFGDFMDFAIYIGVLK